MVAAALQEGESREEVRRLQAEATVGFRVDLASKKLELERPLLLPPEFGSNP